MEVLMWVLTGKAGGNFTSGMNKYPQLRFGDIVDKLVSRFGRNDIPKYLMAQFMTETQEPNASSQGPKRRPHFFFSKNWNHFTG